MSTRCIPVLLATAFLSGCLYHVREDSDRLAQCAAQRPIDPAPTSQQESSSPADNHEATAAATRAKPKYGDADLRTADALDTGGVRPASADMLALTQGGNDVKRFEIPAIIPGSEAVLPLQIPRDPEERRRVIDKLYPDLPPLPNIPVPVPGPQGRPFTLADFQRIAAEHSPQLIQA